MAGRLGFEPKPTVLETACLPLAIPPFTILFKLDAEVGIEPT